MLTFVALPLASARAQVAPQTFAPGDIFISVDQSSVQWRNADGALKGGLVSRMSGKVEGLQLDPAGNLYVTHHCTDHLCTGGNSIEQFNTQGLSQGPVGAGYFCNPHSMAFDGRGNVYVGQADCDGSILKFTALGELVQSYYVAIQNRGAYWMDMAADGCTIGYTSWGPDVKLFNVCTNTQLPNLNRLPMPGGAVQALVALPDGGVLVSSGSLIARLDGGGVLRQTYALQGQQQYWAGIDLAGDGTFWAINYYSSNVYRFNIASGDLVGGFRTEAAPQTVVDLRVFRIVPPSGPAPGTGPSRQK
jgi:hypothetical protein